MVDEKYIKNDIKARIKQLYIGYQGKNFLKGYMVACYTLGAITKDTLDELKKCLKDKEED